MVHCCNSRFWYVKDFVLPSMIEQGINPDNIFVYRDTNNIGNLRSFIDSCNKSVSVCEKHNIDGIWHLQDDVVISSKFKEVTEKYDNGLVCGFTCAYDNEPKPGLFRISEREMWFSFPCIRIPKSIMSSFVNWANTNLWQSKYFRGWVIRNKGDDLIFREWLYDNDRLQDTLQLNLSPNIVNHIDDLIGGTVVNPQRDKTQNTRSMFWEEDDVIQTLEDKLKEYSRFT